MKGLQLGLVLGALLSAVSALPALYNAEHTNITHTLEARASNFYMALGSSFAAGPGIPDVDVDEGARQAERSQENYPHFLARLRPDLKLIDRTVARSTLLNLYQDKQVMNGFTFPVRVDYVPRDTKIMTITSGGNDINYIGALGGKGDRNGLTNQQAVDRYKEAIRRIQDKARGVKILLIGYPTVLGRHAYNQINSRDVPLSRAQIDKYARYGEDLREITRQAAAGMANVWFVDITDMSREHGVGSPDPWVNGAQGPRVGGNRDDDAVAYHPNRRGMRAIADLVNRYINDNRIL